MPQTRWRSPRATLAAFGAAIAFTGLSACSNGGLSKSPFFNYGLKLAGIDKKDAAPPEVATVGPPLIVGYQAARVAIPGVGKRGQSQYFSAPDGVEIAMNGSFVTRAIGLGVDLEGMFLPADGPYTQGFVQAARENTVTDRIADYYRKGAILHDSFRCELTYVPREGSKGIVNERCRRIFGGPGFRNTYWTEGDRIVCSLQWFHPDADLLQFFETAEQAQSLDLNKQGC